MRSAILGLLLACYFLAGSVVFPLSDFSLMRDLPGMYRSYCEVKAGEPDVFDFVGDYLLHGKDIFGNNPHDTKPKAAGGLQFQHQPNLTIFYTKHYMQAVTDDGISVTDQFTGYSCLYLSTYYREHFRPPIA